MWRVKGFVDRPERLRVFGAGRAGRSSFAQARFAEELCESKCKSPGRHLP